MLNTKTNNLSYTEYIDLLLYAASEVSSSKKTIYYDGIISP